MTAKKPDFTRKLLKWHKNENTRAMPWKGEKDPYRIWLSEVILQQTRVEQGWAYYEKFIEAFPTIRDLALASEQKVFKLWEGLGYYSRCRNLIATAKKINSDLGGQFPTLYGDILDLKGIGPYTAAAIASFAFNLPHAVLDGNVFRVLARYFGRFTPIDTTAGKKEYSGLADSLLDKDLPGIYNQAIMDFGAVVCKPQNPLCTVCVQQTHCRAFQEGWVRELPVKEKSIRKKNRWLTYFIAETPDEKIYIRQRKEKDIWEDLFEFVCWEREKETYPEEILQSDPARQFFGKQTLTVSHISKVYRQELSHQTIRGQFVSLRLEKPLPDSNGYTAVPKKNLNEYAFPRFINTWLQDSTPVQNLF